MTNIDELLANLGPECGLSELSDDEMTYYEALDSFKVPKTICVDLSTFENEQPQRARLMWAAIRTELEKANVDWKTKEVALNFECSESFELGFGEMFDIINAIDDQVQKLYWTYGFVDNTSVSLTYCGEE